MGATLVFLSVLDLVSEIAPIDILAISIHFQLDERCTRPQHETKSYCHQQAVTLSNGHTEVFSFVILFCAFAGCIYCQIIF